MHNANAQESLTNKREEKDYPMRQFDKTKDHIIIHSLVLELTRKCNAHCEHCLRGDARNEQMPFHTIDEILNTVSEIYTVTFSGGEPTLNLDAMEHFFNQAARLNKYPSSFFVATNGCKNQERLASILLRAYAEIDEPEYCAVALSTDEYHDCYQDDYIKGLKFYSPIKEKDSIQSDDWVILSGRAADNQLGHAPATHTRFDVTLPESEHGDIEIQTLYIAANGFIYPDCDLSYNVMDKHKLVTIGQFPDYILNLPDEDFIKL